jgi:hypothetical protein
LCRNVAYDVAELTNDVVKLIKNKWKN